MSEQGSDQAEFWQRTAAARMGGTAYVVALGGSLESVGTGRSRMRLPYSQKLVGNPDTGVVHGGVITAFLDQTCGAAVGSALREPMAFATLDLRIDYMKPATPGRDLFFEGECIKVTHDIAFARGRAFHDTPEDPIAIANAAFMFTRGVMPMGTMPPGSK
jgi:uncharacterized protein (TIGR00369 family)